jgi:hypothetical protein
MRPSVKQLILNPIFTLTVLFLTMTACTPTAGQTVPITVTRVLPTATADHALPNVTATQLPLEPLPAEVRVSVPDSTTSTPPLPGMVYRADTGLWRIDAEGEAIFLTSRLDGTLSPDSRHLLFQEDGNFWVVETAETAQPINLTATSQRQHTRAQWWPGRPGTILLGHWKDSPAPDVLTDYFLAMVNVDGSDYRLLGEGDCPFGIGAPTPSPDGQAVLYRRCEPFVIQYLDGALQTIGLQSFSRPSNIRLLSLAEPTWSPDGHTITWIAIIFDRSNDTQGTGVEVEGVEEYVVGLFDMESKTGRLLPFEPEWEPAKWSPDGRWFAVKDAFGGVRVFSTDASQQYYLEAARSDLFWGMDDQLVFAANTPAPLRYYLFDAGTGSITQSVELPGLLVDWQP